MGAARRSELLAEDWGVAADVWSVTSWNELRRDALAADERNLLHPDAEPASPYVTAKLADASGPVVAVSRLHARRAGPDRAVGATAATTRSLGADGFGFADTRGAARRFFHIDAESVVVAVLARSPSAARSSPRRPREAFEKYRIDDVSAAERRIDRRCRLSRPQLYNFELAEVVRSSHGRSDQHAEGRAVGLDRARPGR